MDVFVTADRLRAHGGFGGEMELGVVGVAEFSRQFLCDHAIVVDPLSGDGAVRRVDDPDGSAPETKDRGTDILHCVIRDLTVEQVFLPAVYTDGVAHQIAHQVHHVNNLFHELPAGFAPVPPPGRMEGIAEISCAHQPW